MKTLPNIMIVNGVVNHYHSALVIVEIVVKR